MSADRTLDKIAHIVCKEKQEEIERLRRQIKSTGEEGRELCMKYCTMVDPHSPIDLFSDAHDLFDFLQAI